MLPFGEDEIFMTLYSAFFDIALAVVLGYLLTASPVWNSKLPTKIFSGLDEDKATFFSVMLVAAE